LFLAEFEVQFIIPALHLLKDFIVLIEPQLSSVRIATFKFTYK